MERFETDCVVVGAGVVGLAVAAALARAGRSVVVLEKNRAIGEETSSRNSEVIHAGLYYEPGSLKGRYCVAGRERLFERAERAGFGAARCGKLIVATEPDEEPALETIRARAAGNGVTELEPISGAAARAMEPALRAVSALWSPLTGVVDSHGFMLSLLGEAEDHGAMLALGTRVERVAPRADGLSVIARADDGGRTALAARIVVNAAGLWAPVVAAAVEGLPADARPAGVYTKGNYFVLTGARIPFSRLIYPAPVPGGLGVHLTIDLGGGARFGPDVERIAAREPGEIDYAVDPGRAEAFYGAIRRYWPGLPDGSLAPGYAGVRPKIHEDYQTDFRIDGPAEHGVAGLWNLFGFESPALTGALAIGDDMADRIAAAA